MRALCLAGREAMQQRDMEAARRLGVQSQALQAEIAALRGLHTETEGSMAVQFRGRMQDAL